VKNSRRRRRRPGALGAVPAVALVSALALTGCGPSGGTSGGGNLPVASAPSEAPDPGPSAHPLGQTVDADHSFIEATVYSYQQPVAKDAPRPNPGAYEWAAVDVRSCASKTSIFAASVSSLRWEVVYSDDTALEPTRVSYPQFPQPLYPSTQYSLKPGECVRGFIVFPVPAGAKPLVVRYAPYNAPSVDWQAGPAA
jgi:hypothetical protein